MSDHLSQAEMLLKPREVISEEPHRELHPGEAPQALHSARQTHVTLPADPAAAQVHATLAVAEQLARIATALEGLAGGHGGPEPR